MLAPDLPGHTPGGGSVAGLSMSDYAKALGRFCAELPEPPVLLGHSMGGLVSQMAARRVKPRAVVLLAPSAPWGVSGSSIEEAVTALGVSVADPFWTGMVAVVVGTVPAIKPAAQQTQTGVIGILVGDTFNFAAVGRLGPRRAGAVYALNAPMTAVLGWAVLEGGDASGQWLMPLP